MKSIHLVKNWAKVAFMLNVRDSGNRKQWNQPIRRQGLSWTYGPTSENPGDGEIRKLLHGLWIHRAWGGRVGEGRASCLTPDCQTQRPRRLCARHTSKASSNRSRERPSGAQVHTGGGWSQFMKILGNQRPWSLGRPVTALTCPSSTSPFHCKLLVLWSPVCCRLGWPFSKVFWKRDFYWNPRVVLHVACCRPAPPEQAGWSPARAQCCLAQNYIQGQECDPLCSTAPWI